MLGLQVDGKPLMRAYSIASANHEEYHKDSLSIKVADGLFDVACRTSVRALKFS
jgi:ferredoxin-NADP reductase